jgi:signal transduction histidine kinase
VVLCVADRGPGVPEEERERIFEPFYRPPGTRRTSDKGVGLGLALVRQIARHHRGDAHCLPREGGGTRFEVTFRTKKGG